MADGAKNKQQLLQDLLGPMDKSALQEVSKFRKEQVAEAFQSGVPLEKIEQQILAKAQGGGGQQQATQQPQAQQPLQQAQQQQQQTKIPPIPQLLGGLIKQHPAVRGQVLQNLIGEQQIKGQVPLQLGEKQKLVFAAQQKQIETLKKDEKAGNLKPNEIFGKFESSIKEFEKVENAFARVQASVIDPSAAGDLALIFNYMKMLDPDSVVRESEFANAAATGALGERFIAVGKRIAEGQRLSPAMRSDFFDRSKKLMAGQRKRKSTIVKEFEGLAKRNKLDPSNIIRSRTENPGGVIMQDAQGNKALVDPNTGKVIKEL